MKAEEFQAEIRENLRRVPLDQRKAWDHAALSSWSQRVREALPHLTWRTRGSVWQAVPGICGDLIGPQAN